ncbi:MAG TPA: DUF1844 domain-containing protein [Candidatus Omnitrophota bacterium]|nr:DUF1844 domain-containing protein [Candidatus Omnitrophota bacterium]
MDQEGKTDFSEKKVDESWKNSVQKEKQTEEPEKTPPRLELNFSNFINSFAIQVLIHLGQIEDPVSKKKEINLEAAHEIIDLLAMLKEKTKGNLTREEDALLTHLIPDLQMRYVEAMK